jgi:DNA-nicking Smr family endonuclease
MPPKTNPANHPFEILRKLVDRGKIKLAPDTDKAVQPPPKVDGSLSDEEAFRQAMEDVQPLGWSEAPLKLPDPIEIPQRSNDEGEALERLERLVEGRGEIDPFLTGEGVEGAATQRGRSHLGRLRKGDYSVQAHLDLHGLTLDDAKAKFDAFIREAQKQGYNCVRIVHGRGKHSPTEPAVLKTHLTRWLSSRKMRRVVVAFASARWMDGGSGALYVLLYRKRRPPET